MECFECNGKLPKNGNQVHCHACNGDYHFKCTALSERSYKSMSKAEKIAWSCHQCIVTTHRLTAKKNSRKKSDSEQDSDESDMSEIEAEVGRKSRGNVNSKGLNDKSIEQLFINFENKLWKKMSKKFNEMEESLEFTSGKIDEFTKTMKAIQKKLVMVEVENEKIRQENVELKTKVKSLEAGVEANAQLLGNTNKIEISGLPVSTNNPKKVVANILEKVNGEKVEESGYGFDVIKLEKQTNVVVHFESMIQRDKIIKKKRNERIFKLGEIMNTSDDSLIYLNECLTPYYAKLFTEAKKVKKDKNYAFLWVRDGKILLKKTEQSKPMRLMTMEDLGNI
ncbi:hypothetical protein WDU94_003576 [Cyamophila willieti]